MQERWRRVLSFAFSLVVMAIALAAIIEIQSSDHLYIAAVAIVGITAIVLVFGIQLDSIEFNASGVTIMFTEGDERK